jgi:hypothetical protein
MVWDFNRRCYRKTGVVMAPVKYPGYDHPLWLGVCRPGRGRKPWYLLTNQPINSLEDAGVSSSDMPAAGEWRWPTGIPRPSWPWEGPRLWRKENPLKLLLLVSLVYAFLLSLINYAQRPLVELRLRHWCHRTGKRYRQAAIPLYQVGAALSHFWITCPPESQLIPSNSERLMYVCCDESWQHQIGLELETRPSYLGRANS